MSLLNALIPPNIYWPIIMQFLEMQQGEFERFRDAYPSEDGKHIYVLARVGGENRKDYPEVFRRMEMHPGFIEVKDDEFDNTYCTFKFKTPEECVLACSQIADETDVTPPLEKFKRLIDDLQNNRDNAMTSRAMDFGKKLFDQLKAGGAGTIKNETGSVCLIPIGDDKAIGDKENFDATENE